MTVIPKGQKFMVSNAHSYVEPWPTAADRRLTLFARMMAKKAVTAWINTKYCPECGCLRTEHAVGCVFPAMMEPLEAK